MQLNRDDDRSVNISDVCVSVQKRAFFSPGWFCSVVLTTTPRRKWCLLFRTLGTKRLFDDKVFFQKKRSSEAKRERGSLWRWTSCSHVHAVAAARGAAKTFSITTSLSLSLLLLGLWVNFCCFASLISKAVFTTRGERSYQKTAVVFLGPFLQNT